jgi:hypothetical protein
VEEPDVPATEVVPDAPLLAPAVACEPVPALALLAPALGVLVGSELVLSEAPQPCIPTANAPASTAADTITNRFMREAPVPGFEEKGQNAGLPLDRSKMRGQV